LWWVWLLATVGGLVAIIVVLLSIPVDVNFRVDVHKREAAFRTRIGWLFNLVSWEVRPLRRKPRRKKPAKKRKRREWVKSGRMAWRALRTPGLLDQSCTLLRDLIHSVKLRDLALDLRIGLGNPFDTGMLFGFVGPIVACARSMLPYEMNFQVSFNGPEFEGHSHANLRLWPILAVGAGLRFGFSRPARRIARMYMAESWKKDGK